MLGDARLLYCDNHLLALGKPAGLLSQRAQAGDDCLLERGREYVRAQYDKQGNVFLGLVHRLDRNVSGVMVFARTSKAAARLTRAFSERRVDKRYLAVVEGETDESGELRDRLGPRPDQRGVRRDPEGKEAILSYVRLAEAVRRSLLEVTLHTGRKHQIRAQLALAGHPITGDLLYGQRTHAISRPALHAARLSLEHPVGKEPMIFEMPPPADLARLIERFGTVATDLTV